jgi:tetratricopeptide (TPR) repeat protein
MPPPILDPEAALARCIVLYEQARANGLGSGLNEVPRLLPLLTDANVRGEMAKLYAVRAMRLRDYAVAAEYSARACQDLPDDRVARMNGLVSLLQLGRFDEAIAVGRAGIARDPGAFAYHDGLAEALSRAGRIDEARGHGTLSLVFKDQEATGTARDLSEVSVKPFSPGEQNVIAFSLFGDGERYCRGAIANAKACPFIYPGWRCRFYVDVSVPDELRRQLGENGADVLLVGGLPAAAFGTFWRMMVANDPAVDRYLVRDADSVINVRERVAVDEWIESGRHFHIMRDQVLQSELVLAGMWGGVAGAFPALLEEIQAFVRDAQQSRGRTADQEFLRERLWPTIRQSVLVHDSQFAFGERRDFPRVGGLLPGRVIGDWALKDGRF